MSTSAPSPASSLVPTAQDPSTAPISRGLVVLLATACGLSVANLYYAQPILAAIAERFGVSAQSAGLVVTLAQVGYAVGLALVVPVGDVANRRVILPMMLAFTAAALAGSAAAPSITVLATAAALIGVGSVVAQMLVPLAASLADDDARSRVVGSVMSGLLLGILLARTFSGLLADAAGWRMVYVTAGILMLALAVVLRRCLPDEAARPRVAYRATLASTAALFVSERQLRRRTLFGAAAFAAFSAVWTTVTFLLARAPYHYSEGVIGLFGLLGAAGVLAATVAGRWAGRANRQASTLLFAVMIAGSFLVLRLGEGSLGALIAGILILDIAVQSLHVTNQSIIYGIAPELRSRINSVYMVCFFAGGVLGSAIGSHIYSDQGWSGVCELGAIIGAVAVIAAVVDILRPACALQRAAASE
jgi:predicted MFS family arabinose efflux permease